MSVLKIIIIMDIIFQKSQCCQVGNKTDWHVKEQQFKSHRVIKVAEVGVSDALASRYSSSSMYLPFLNGFHFSKLRVALMERDYFLKHLKRLVYSPLRSAAFSFQSFRAVH